MSFLTSLFQLLLSFLSLDLFLWLSGTLICFAIICAIFNVISSRR